MSSHSKLRRTLKRAVARGEMTMEQARAEFDRQAAMRPRHGTVDLDADGQRIAGSERYFPRPTL